VTNERTSLPTSVEVIEALRAAGWLLEQDTASTLERAGFYTVTGKAFPDPDDPTVSREIDVHAYRQLFRSDELSLSVGVRVLAECKQSSMPYVVVGGQASAYELERERQEQHFRFPRIETGRTAVDGGGQRLHYTPAREYLGLDRLPGNPWEGGFLGTQLVRLERKAKWLAGNDGIFTSLVYPLAKALTHFRGQFNRSSYAHHKPGASWASVDFYYPIVVTSAELFAVDTSVTEIEAVRVPWATVTREIKSSKIDGRVNIDVVTANALEEYIERVNSFGRAVAELVEADPHRFVAHEDHGYTREGAS